MLDLFQPGAFARAAGGNLERADLQAPVVRWMAWSINPDNGANGNPAAWDRCRALWTQAWIEHFPWLHCRSLLDIERLIHAGELYNSPAIGLNIEDVQADFTSKGISLADIAQKLSAWPKPIHLATLPWVQNGQGWGSLRRCVAALEIFPDENEASKDVSGCIAHAFSEGLTQVTLMFKTKLPPSTFDLSICHSLYTADDIQPTSTAWTRWESPQPCKRLVKEETMPEKPPLGVKKFPYTGPCFGPSSPKGPTLNRPTVKALKRAMIRLRYLNQKLGSETDDYGAELENAMSDWERTVGVPPAGQYGRGAWTALRSAVLTEGPNAGSYALDALALKYVREDALTLCYPHPQGALSQICQGLHPTAGLTGNWAIDFCAPGGTKVLAVERATIRKLSGRDPARGANQTIGIFGWSIHYETADGYRYFSTHYGSRASLAVGQVVEVGQTLGLVGNWPGDPSRSHTHLGVTSPLGIADAKKRITAVSQAARV